MSGLPVAEVLGLFLMVTKRRPCPAGRLGICASRFQSPGIPVPWPCPRASLRFTRGQRAAGPSFQLPDAVEHLLCASLSRALGFSSILDMAPDARPTIFSQHSPGHCCDGLCRVSLRGLAWSASSLKAFFSCGRSRRSKRNQKRNQNSTHIADCGDGGSPVASEG